MSQVRLSGSCGSFEQEILIQRLLRGPLFFQYDQMTSTCACLAETSADRADDERNSLPYLGNAVKRI